jgi:hypothetical protein
MLVSRVNRPFNRIATLTTGVKVGGAVVEQSKDKLKHEGLPAPIMEPMPGNFDMLAFWKCLSNTWSLDDWEAFLQLDAQIPSVTGTPVLVLFPTKHAVAYDSFAKHMHASLMMYG